MKDIKNLKAEKIEYIHQKIAREPYKKIVAVVFGGASNEREISLESGRNVLYKLPSEKYQALPIFLGQDLTFHLLTHEQLVLNSTHEISACLHESQRWSLEDLKRNVDFVFLALHGGQGENGTLQGALEMLQIPYNGSGVLTSALCMDKYKTNQYLKASGFHLPENTLIDLSALENLSAHIKIPFPVIAKPHNDGCSVGVQKVNSQEELQSALLSLKNNKHTHALVEEYIVGMELTVGVLGNHNPQALPPSAAIASSAILSIEEKFLPGAGENQTPAPLPQATLTLIQREIERVFAAVDGTGYARIDCFYQSAQQSPTGSERLVVLEINTLPGLTPATVIFHQAAEIGMSPSQFLDAVVALGFEKHGKAIVSEIRSMPENSAQAQEIIASA